MVKTRSNTTVTSKSSQSIPILEVVKIIKKKTTEINKNNVVTKFKNKIISKSNFTQKESIVEITNIMDNWIEKFI